MPGSKPVVVVVLLLAVIGCPASAAPSAPAATAENATATAAPTSTGGETTIANNLTVERVANDTYQLGIGTEGPRMLLRFNLSLFGNFPDAGVLRFTGLGLIDGEFVIEIDLSLLFDGIDTLGQFIANPFDHFTVDGRTVLDLPFPTADDAAGSPVESAG